MATGLILGQQLSLFGMMLGLVTHKLNTGKAVPEDTKHSQGRVLGIRLDTDH